MSTSRTRKACRTLLAGLFVVAIMCLISSVALAQSDNTNPKWDLFVGYQYLHTGITTPATTSSPNNPSPYHVPDMTPGAGAALTYNFDKYWGAEFDFGQNWSNSNYVTTASVGPRLMMRTEDANYFIHALVSYNRLNVNALGDANNGIGAILGGGMEFPITKHIAFRLFEADYVWSHHNYANFASLDFPDLRRPTQEGVRLRTGLTFAWGGAPAVAPSAACSVQPSEVLVGEPITATVTPSNFNPKHALAYSWSGNGGTVTGKDTTANIDTANAAPGNYTVTAHAADAKAKNGEASCSASYTVKPLPPKNPPTVSLSANPNSLLPGGTANVSANCTSPDGVPVSVSNWSSTGGSVSGSGSSASLNTSGASPGTVTVSATCTDSRGLSTQASTPVTIQNPPPPPVDRALEARLALHSVYFPTALPSPTDPNGGLIPSQQKTLATMATDFKKYLQAKPDAHLVLEGHADVRGAAAYNQALSERRVARVKSYLVEQGVPEGNIETKAFGAQHNLTQEEVSQSIQQNTELTTEERNRALARIQVIKLASNRRVDVTLNAGGQTETSVRQFPFNAADALSLIGGRESEKKPVRKPGAKKPVKKQ